MAMAESRRGDDGRDGRDGESEQLARLLATLLPRLLRRLPEGGLFEGDAGHECPKMPDIAAPFPDDGPRRAAGCRNANLCKRSACFSTFKAWAYPAHKQRTETLV